MPGCKKWSSEARLDGKTAVITGCNTGIGKETALDFVKRGARVIMACRSVEKAEEAAEEIKKHAEKYDGEKGILVAVRLDLSSLKSVRECAQYLLKTEPKIHLLINNAGVMACPKTLTEDGFEMQFGVNHLGHFLFTCLLIPRIKSSAPARIVNVSSNGYAFGTINFDDINSEKSYSAFGAYGQSKLANILFTQELARRLEGTGVTTYTLHPGGVKTDLQRHVDDTYFRGARQLTNVLLFFMKTPKDGALTTIYCAIEEKVSGESGFYYNDCKKEKPSKKARDVEVARRLWDESVKMVGLQDWNPFTAEDKQEF